MRAADFVARDKLEIAMAFANGLKKVVGGGMLASRLMKRSLQMAVLVAVSASVPEAWSAGGHIQVNNVAAGSATFSQVGSVTTVRTGSNNTIINYQQLSVGSGETLDFVQPTSHSRVLNRIEGSTPTRIDGTLESNGIVYLVNPAGVMFGQGAVVNVGGLFAAAAHISDHNFLGGVNQFTGSSGAVQNYGTISASQVHLVGLTVGNFGEIVAGQGGVVTMTSGDDVYIGAVSSPAGSPHVMVKVSANKGVTKSGTGVTNGGTISAPGGQVSLGAGDLYAAGIYNSGTIKGAQITLDSGANTNITSGNIDASNASGKGGTVKLLGDKVAVDSGTVDASGKTGGGVILVGGDLHGAGNVATSSRTFIGQGANLLANATVTGNGGEVVVWSNEVTRYYGNIGASGGTVSGNGGYVEVSSKQALYFVGTVNTDSPNGASGTLLLDPSFIDVNTQGTANFTLTTQVDNFTDPDSGSGKIDPSTLAAVTTGNVVLQSTGDITFSSALSMGTAGVGIIAQAGGNIAVNNNITTKGGIISLSAGDQTPGAGGGVNPGLAAGNIAIGNNNLDTTNGTAAGANVILRAGGITLNSGATIKGGTGGSVSFLSNIATHTFTIGLATGGDISLSATDLSNVSSASKIVLGEQGIQSGLITVKQLTLTSNIPLEINSNAGAGEVLLDNGGGGGGSAVNIGGAIALTIRAGTGGILAAQVADAHSEFTSGTTTLTSAGDIGNVTNPIHPATTAGTISATSTAGNVTMVGLGNLTLGTISGGNVSITSTGNMSTGTVTATAGTLDLEANGGGTNNIVESGTLSATGALTVNALGTITNTSGNISGGSVTLGSVGDISIASATATAGTLAATTTTSGNINATGNFSATGTLTLTAVGAIGNTASVGVSPTAGLVLSTGAGKNITVTVNNSLLASNLTLPAGSARTVTMTVNGDFTVDANTGSALDNYVISTKTGSGGNITSSGGFGLTGLGITLSADGAVNLITTTSGALGVTTAGVGGLGNITIVETNSPDITTTTASASGQTISLTAASFTANHSYGDANHNDNVVLIASTGAINGSATSIVAHDLTLSGTTIGATAVHADITGNLSLTTTVGGATVVMATTNTLNTANLTLNVLAGQLIDLTSGTINVNANVGSASNDLNLTSTVGGITGTSTVTANNLALSSATGIGNSTVVPLLVSTTGTLGVTSAGANSAGNIFVSDTAALTLTAVPTTDSGTGQTISLASSNASGITVNASLTLGTGDSLTLTAASAGGTITVNAADVVTATNLTLTADNFSFGALASLVSTNTIAIAPFTSGRGVDLTSVATPGGVLVINNNVLAQISAPNIAIGNSTTGLIIIGQDTALDYSGNNFNLTFTAPNGLTFANTLTLKNNGVLTINSPSAVTSSGGADVIIGGTTGTITFVGITGNIGASGTPLNTEVEQIGGVTGAGAIFLSNTVSGTLTITGAITLTNSTGSVISDASPLTVNSAVSMAGSFSLIAGDSVSAGDDLTLAANVTSSTNGTVTLQAGDNITQTAGTVSGGIVIMTADHEADGTGSISQSGTGAVSVVTSLTADAAQGITLAGANTIPQVSITNTTSGTIALTTGGSLSIASVSQNGGGSMTFLTGGNVTQSGAILGSGSNLIVRSRLNGGADITLTQANNIGTGTVTLEALNTAGSSPASGNLSFTSAGAINVQRLNTTANVTLASASTIGQDLTDTVGIHSVGLTTTNTGAVTLTNGNNTFSNLNETDSSGSLPILAFTTNAAGGLTISGLQQTLGGTATITNTGGAITATNQLTEQFFNLSAKGGISITNTSNIFQSVTATNTTSGDITIVNGTLILPLIVTSLSNTGGGATFLTGFDGVQLNGTIAAGSGLTVSVPTANKAYGTNASAVITTTGGGAISITADNMNIDPASTTTTTGAIVLKPFTVSTVITLNGSDGAGVLGITSAELSTISAASITIGGLLQTGDVNGSGTFNLPVNTTFITAGNVDFSAVNVTTAAGVQLTVNHGGTLTLANASLSGGLVETGLSGSGAGGTVTLDAGTVTLGNGAVTFNSALVVAASANLATGGTGTNFTFGTVNGLVGGESLTITAGTGTVTFNGGVGTTTALGNVQVVSSGAINLGGNIVTNGGFVSLNSTGAITLVGGNRTIDTTNAGGNFLGNDIQLAAGVTGGANSLTLTGGSLNGNISLTSFTSTGNFTASGKRFMNSGTISANVISITNARPATISGDLIATGNLTVDGSASAFSTFTDTSNALSGLNVTVTQSGAISIGGTITSVGNVTLTSTGSSISTTALVSGAGTIQYSAATTVATGNVTDTTGAFSSSGTDFSNAGDISAVGITITNTGVETFSGKLIAGTGNLSVTGAGSITDTASALSGKNVTLTGSGAISVGGTITSLGNVTVTSSISSISTTALVSGAGTIQYSAATTVATGNVTDTTGAFTSSGTGFSNAGDISAVGITITNTGAETFSGKLIAGSGNLSVTGAGSITDTASALSGKNVTLTGSGAISIGGTITSLGNVTVSSTGSSISTTALVSGAGTIQYSAGTTVATGNVTDTTGAFSSSGTDFSNAGDISAVGITITNSGIDTFSGKLIAGSGNLSVTGAGSITDIASALSGGNVTLSASGAVSVGGTITSLANVTVTSTASSISTTALVSGAGTIQYSAGTTVATGNVTDTTGAFSSSGTAFTNSGNITAVGITITNTGIDTFNAPLAAGTGALSVTGATSITDTASALSGAGVTLGSSGAISVGSTITSTGIVSLTSTLSTISVTGNISAAGDTTLTSLGSTTTGNVTTTSGNISIDPSSVANLNGNVNAGSGNVGIGGTAALTGTIAVTGSTVTFANTITGAGTTLNVTAHSAIFDGNIGTGVSPLTALTVTATGSSPTTTFNSLASGVFATTQTFGSAVTLNSNFAFTGTSFTFSGALNTVGATSLAITGSNAGTLTLAGPTIGTTLAPFSSVTITDVTSASVTGSMVATGNISIDHAVTHVPVTLTGSITATAGFVSIPGAITLGTGSNSITAGSTAAAVTIVPLTLGTITGPTTANLLLKSNSPGNGSGITIVVGAIGSSGSRIGDLDVQSADVTNLLGDIFAKSVTFEDNVAGSPGINPANVPVVATIFHVGSSLTINTDGAFTMEQNQKLTVYNTTPGSGNLVIDTSAGNGLITVGDLSALGSITLDTGSPNNPIHILNRPGAKVLKSNGTLSALTDNGTDIVSGVAGNGGLLIRGSVLVIQPGGLPTTNSFVSLATGNPSNDLTLLNGFKVDAGNLPNILKQVPQVPPTPAVTPTDFTFVSGPNTQVLDLQAIGVPANIADIQGTVIPADVATVQLDVQWAISGALRDALNELGIYARDLRTDEILAYLVGRALYDDVPYKLDPDPTDNKIATNRLPYSPVLPMVDAYERLFFKDEVDASGKHHKVPQDKTISNAIGSVWVVYSAQMKDKATGDGFRGFLEANLKNNPKFALALEDINQLRSLLIQIKNLGLTSNEFNVAQTTLLKRVRPANIKDADFLAAVMGPSTLTRGQTAMK